MDTLKMRLDDMCSELGFGSNVVKDICCQIVDECSKQNKFNVTVSKGELELLVYTESDGTFSNIIVSETGLVEYMYIPKNKL